MTLHPGLCAACTNARVVTSGKGSTFWLCELSRVDPAFPKYPPLPVVRCPGFTPRRDESEAVPPESGAIE